MYIDDFNAPESQINLTTFYGIDLNPGASDDDFLLGGVDPINPQFEMLTETYIGKTQTFDADTSYWLTQSEYDILPQFANFDFSRFGGDPNDRYFAFSATVPLDQFVTAEEAGLGGDFDDDGDVDGDDFLVWQTGFGQTGEPGFPGDADFDGDVDGDDFLIWQANFGSGPGNGSSSSAVPEPSTVILLGMAFAGLAVWRRR